MISSWLAFRRNRPWPAQRATSMSLTVRVTTVWLEILSGAATPPHASKAARAPSSVPGTVCLHGSWARSSR